MAMQGSHHGALRNFSIFFTVFPILIVCIFIQSKFNVLKLMFMTEHFYFDMSVKFDKFLKNNLDLCFLLY